MIDRPEAEDIGGAINAAMKAIADENEELGGALPRNYNSLEKPILRELLKILVMRFKGNCFRFTASFIFCVIRFNASVKLLTRLSPRQERGSSDLAGTSVTSGTINFLTTSPSKSGFSDAIASRSVTPGDLGSSELAGGSVTSGIINFLTTSTS
ncbi:hypothetical protein [Microcoleus sp. K4-B3]|uniref:hypothetical protein n=1 Tax=Microcoleus sp. K4-B3 TaxID=2818791 RepID=UPI002FD7458F